MGCGLLYVLFTQSGEQIEYLAQCLAYIRHSISIYLNEEMSKYLEEDREGPLSLRHFVLTSRAL